MTPDRAHRRPGELAFALVLLVFSVAAFWQAHAISGFSGKTTAGVFPMLAAAVMIVSALVILVSTARVAPPSPEEQGFFAEVMTRNHVFLVGLVLGYVVLMPLLGFVVSSALFLLSSFQFLWRKNVLITLALTTLTLCCVYGVFRIVFQVVLPQGALMQVFYK